MTEDTIAVVEESHAKDEAYQQGFAHFRDMELSDRDEFTTKQFKESDRWSSTVAPKLRATAGMADDGTGNYQGSRDIAYIRQGDEDDRPAEALVISAREVYRELVDEFDRGARMAADHAAVEVDNGP